MDTHALSHRSCTFLTLVRFWLQVRTFSRDELKSLFKVDPNIKCDTHKAIKCSCDGSAAAADAKAAAFAASSSAADTGAAGAADKLGVQAWAHYADAADATVDPMWDKMGSWVRDKFVTYIFSDHTLLEPKEEPAEDADSSQQADDSDESEHSTQKEPEYEDDY